MINISMNVSNAHEGPGLILGLLKSKKREEGSFTKTIKFKEPPHPELSQNTQRSIISTRGEAPCDQSLSVWPFSVALFYPLILLSAACCQETLTKLKSRG